MTGMIWPLNVTGVIENSYGLVPIATSDRHIQYDQELDTIRALLNG